MDSQKLNYIGRTLGGCFEFYDEFNEQLTDEIIDMISKFKILHFGNYFNQLVDNLKEGVEEINLIGNFNKKITNLPKSVKKLNILSSKFNENLLLKNTNIQEIFLKIFDKNIVYDSKFELPTTIVKLTLENFNWQIGFDIFPDELRLLTLSKLGPIYFSLDNLPKKLEKLNIVDTDINVSLDHLPQNLCNLRIRGSKFSRRLDYLPENLRYFSLENMEYNEPLDYLPENIVRIELISVKIEKLDYLPRNLRELYMSRVNESSQFRLDNLPETLEKLDMIYFNLENLNYLPENLRELRISSCRKIKNINFPKNLINCILCYLNKNHLSNLPRNLQKLDVFDNCSLDCDNLPMIRELKMNNKKEISLDNLPISLEKLELYVYHKINLTNLPINLKKLVLVFETSPFDITIPDNIEILEIISYMGNIAFDCYNLTPSLKLPKNLIRLKTNSIKFPTNVGPNVKSIEIPCIGKKEEFSKKYPHIEILV